MTNKEWINLIAKEFNVSNTIAKGMLHSMYEAKRILSVNKDIRKEQQEQREQREQREKEAKLFAEWERQDEEDAVFISNHNRWEDIF